MKVISQLLEYFIERGALSRQQLQALALQGLYELPEPGGEAVTTEPNELPWTESSAPKPRKRGGHGRPKIPVLEHAALAEWITQSIPKWTPQLRALLPIARVVPLEKAVIAIRNADSNALHDVLREALKQRDPALDALWTAIGFDRYREILSGAKGPVAAAYRAILQCDENIKGSKYAWLLKEPTVRWVYNLALAQRRLLAAMGRFYDDEPEALARALTRDNHDVAYAAFALLYNARRSPPDKIVTRIAAHASPVEWLAIGCNGGTLFSSTGDNAVSAWDARTGALAYQMETEHPVVGLEASPDGRLLAMQTSKGVLELRELSSSGIPGPQIPLGSWTNRGARFGGNGRVVSRMSTGHIGVWDTATREVKYMLFPELPKCSALTYSSDGKILIIAGWDGTTLTLDLESGLRRIVEHFYETPPKLAFDSERLRSAVIHAGRLSTCPLGGTISELTDYGLPDYCQSALAYQPISGWLAVAGSTEVFLINPVTNESRIFEPLADPTEPLCLHFTTDNTRLIWAGLYGDIIVWDLAGGKPENRWLVGDTRLFAIAVHPSTTLLAVSGRGGVTIWDYSTGQKIHELPPQRSDVLALCFHPHGGQLATGTQSGRVKIWDVSTWMDRQLGVVSSGVTAMAFNPDGKSLTVGGGSKPGGALRCWDLAGNPVWWWSGIDGPVHTMAAGPDDASHVFAASKHVVGAWSMTQGLLWRQQKSATQIACCDEGRLLATGGSDGRIELFDAETGASTDILYGAESGIRTLQAGPKPTSLISVAEDGEARLWDIALRRSTAIATGRVRSVAVGGDGAIALGTEDGSIRIRPGWLFQPGPGDAVPQRPLPEFDDWPRAWAQAFIMDPLRVSRLFAYYSENMEACFSPSTYWQLGYEDLGLYCPDSWNFW